MTTKTRTRYIMRENGIDYLVETAEGYCNRRRTGTHSSSIKKGQRMARVRERGYNRREATLAEVRRYGPAINEAA